MFTDNVQILIILTGKDNIMLVFLRWFSTYNNINI